MTPGPECDATLAKPEAVAASLSAKSGDAAAVRSIIAALLPCLGVPILPSTVDGATLRAFLTGSDPGALDVQVDELAAGFAESPLVDLDTFVADLAAQGFTDRATGQPLTRKTLDAGIGRLAAQRDVGGTVPRLLLALGAERARSEAAVVPDPFWGDATLDGVGLLLFGYGLLAAGRPQALGSPGRSAIAAVGRPGAPGLAPRAASGAAAGSLGTIIGTTPGTSTGPGLILGSTLCTSAIVSNTRVQLLGNPFDIWHYKNHGGPHASRLDGRAWYLGSIVPDAVLEAAGCPPPPTGGIAGKDVAWELDAKANAHGSLDPGALTTDALGRFAAIYDTVNETTPDHYLIREYEKKETIRITAEVSGLIPGYGTTITYGSPTPGSASRLAFLRVHWYHPPDYKVDTTNVYGLKCDGFAGAWHLMLRGPGGGGTVTLSGDLTMSIDPYTRNGPLHIDGRANTGLPVYSTFAFDGAGTVVLTMNSVSDEVFVRVASGNAKGISPYNIASDDGTTATLRYPLIAGDFCP